VAEISGGYVFCACSITGIKCPPPPPLPPNYVHRQRLLEEMVRKLCQSTIHPNSYGTSLTVTGAGGFGKTSLVTALCHHPIVKEQFADGIVFIELGPQATDPSMKLSQLYHLLTDQYLKQGDINYAKQEINQLTFTLCHHLLVIIDDVWHVEDAEPIVKAFSNCKIVLTTRMNDIEQYIPTKQVVSVGPMEQSEAIFLLTCGEINDISQLSQEDVSLLNKLAEDVHLWPLLLSLIRGQLSHNLKYHTVNYHEAIHNVQEKLHDKGLTAFDKKNVEKSRKYAVKICITVSLDLLTKSSSDKMKSLILYTGIGTSLQTAVLHNLWNISEYEARDVIDLLWAYGLVQFTDIKMPPHNSTQQCVEVHAVISQYIIEAIEFDDMISLGPVFKLSTSASVLCGSTKLFDKCYGKYDNNVYDYLKYKQNALEYVVLPLYLKKIHLTVLTDPHFIIHILQRIQVAVMISPKIAIFFPMLYNQMNSLISECREILQDVHRWSRTFNQEVQRWLVQRNYSNLIQTIENYVSKYRLPPVVEQAVTLVRKVFPYCDGDLLLYIKDWFQGLEIRTPDYHEINHKILPHIKLFMNEFQQIHASLQTGSPDVETTVLNILSGNLVKEIELVDANYLIKMQEISPLYVRKNYS